MKTGTKRGINGPTRQQREKHGRRAELIAAVWLRLKGYVILARRVRLKSGEIDIVARRGDVLAFIEVKARRDRVTGLESVTQSASRRIETAAQSWAARRTRMSDLAWRYDIIVISPGRLPLHVRDAWRPEFRL